MTEELHTYYCKDCFKKQEQIDRLEQENKKLKEEKQAIKSYLGIEAKTILERLEELDEWKHNDKLLLWKYRSALEEIKKFVSEQIDATDKDDELINVFNRIKNLCEVV